MPDLTPAQREQARDILDGADAFIQEMLEQVKQGAAEEHAIPTAYLSAAQEQHSAAVCELYTTDIESATERFSKAASTYRDAERAARERPPYATAYRRIPMTLLSGLYAAVLAGDEDQAREIANNILALNPEEGADEVRDEVVFNPDKYYLAVCVAGAVVNEVDESAIQELEAINDGKPPVESVYGRGILQLARGIDTADRNLLESAVQSLLEYHERSNNETVVDCILAPQATVAVRIARQHGYDITVDDDLIPEGLIETI